MLRGSIRLFRIRGIQLSVHFTLFLLFAYIAWEGWKAEGLGGAAMEIAALLAFFTCVVLHELGHAFMARRFGVSVPRILLLPIGGMAEFATVPRRPREELLIALAGPAVNLGIIVILSLFHPLPSLQQVTSLDLGIVDSLLVMNLMMGCFNLIPCFPMDGGRVLRALLARRLPYLQATRWATFVAKPIAVIGIVALLTLPTQPNWLGVILFSFILVVGELEYRAVARQDREERNWQELLRRDGFDGASTR